MAVYAPEPDVRKTAARDHRGKLELSQNGQAKMVTRVAGLTILR
jgi:hypothetical protein